MTDYVATVLQDSPLAFWRMGEAAGDFADATGNGHTAVVVDAENLAYASRSLLPRWPVDAGPFFALTSGGLHPYVEAADAPGLNPDPAGAVCVEFWLRATATGSPSDVGAIFHKLNLVGPAGLTPNGYLVYVAPDDTDAQFRVRLEVRDGSPGAIANRTRYQRTALLDFGTTYHVVCRRAGPTALDFVVNGVQQDGELGLPGTGAFVDTTGAPVVLGSARRPVESGQVLVPPPNAVVSHVALYDHFLTNTRALAHYRAGAGGGTSVWMALL